MSVDALAWAWGSGLPPVQRLLLMSYADGATSMASAARATGIPTAEAAALTKQLIRTGWIDAELAVTFERAESLVEQYCKVKIPTGLRRAVYERDEFRCQHCGADEDLSVDHVYPEILGGETTLDNLQTLCRSCNSRKGARV